MFTTIVWDPVAGGDVEVSLPVPTTPPSKKRKAEMEAEKHRRAQDVATIRPAVSEEFVERFWFPALLSFHEPS